MLNITLMDYDVKHIHSLKKALKNYNASATVISNIQQILDFHETTHSKIAVWHVMFVHLHRRSNSYG